MPSPLFAHMLCYICEEDALMPPMATAHCQCADPTGMRPLTCGHECGVGIPAGSMQNFIPEFLEIDMADTVDDGEACLPEQPD